MNAQCPCGMILHPSQRATPCQDCGGACCRSCSVELDARTYCRWCAASLTLISLS